MRFTVDGLRAGERVDVSVALDRETETPEGPLEATEAADTADVPGAEPERPAEDVSDRTSEGQTANGPKLMDVAAHELRSPLGAIRGLVDTLVAQWGELDDDERRDLADRTRRRAHETVDLLERILEFSRLEARRISVTPQALNVLEQVERARTSLGAALADHDVLVIVPDDLEVQADAHAVERVLTNLLTNAAHFSPDGSAITVTARAGEDEVELAVHDEGPGVEPEERERVFDRFYVGSAAAPGGSGSGIGLSLARSYVEALGGRIWVDERAGRGSIFRFTLPRYARKGSFSPC